jgi:hypothetical protein
MRFAIYVVQRGPLVPKEWVRVTFYQGLVLTIPGESISQSASDSGLSI